MSCLDSSFRAESELWPCIHFPANLHPPDLYFIRFGVDRIPFFDLCIFNEQNKTLSHDYILGLIDMTSHDGNNL